MRISIPYSPTTIGTLFAALGVVVIIVVSQVIGIRLLLWLPWGFIFSIMGGARQFAVGINKYMGSHAKVKNYDVILGWVSVCCLWPVIIFGLIVRWLFMESYYEY